MINLLIEGIKSANTKATFEYLPKGIEPLKHAIQLAKPGTFIVALSDVLENPDELVKGNLGQGNGRDGLRAKVSRRFRVAADGEKDWDRGESASGRRCGRLNGERRFGRAAQICTRAACAPRWIRLRRIPASGLEIQRVVFDVRGGGKGGFVVVARPGRAAKVKYKHAPSM